MSFDISRSSFRPRRDFLGVIMQQGRVQLDSDWNEWQSEYLRRIQAGTLDTIGQAVYPASTPNAFQITSGTNANGSTLFIGAGRYYVDGLLAENHGPESEAVWDDALAEMSGAPAFATTNTAQTDYTQQPYLPNAQLPAAGDVCVAYLDVWLRDVTSLEDPDLIDTAVNIDTTGRLQTVWQVKLLNLGNPSATPDCSTDIPAFDALAAPPAGRLTSGLVTNAAGGPCCLAPNTGYTGQENQLYRVEIHTGGTPSAPPAAGFPTPLPASIPTFKWSRDNASVQTSVTAISTVTNSSGSVSQLTASSLGRDQVLGFAVNDWIEITDDAYELTNQPGEIYQIVGVTLATNTITLSATVSGHFPLTDGQTDPELHTRITRWDQSGQVYSTDASGNLTPWYDLGASGAGGVIPVPPTGTTLVLENGVTVSFDLSPEPTAAQPTVFRADDYWLFTARTAAGSVEIITEAPPLGINHHYAKLAIVTLPSTINPCRTEWPPTATGSSCCCTVAVSTSDLTGDTTLQTILSNYQNAATPTTICLDPGTYSLSEPLRLTSAYSNITLEACQPGTVTLQALAGNESQFNDGLIVLDNSASITLSGLTLRVPTSAYSASTFAGLATSALPSAVASMVQNLLVSIGVRIVNGNDISVQKCTLLLADSAAELLTARTALYAAGIFLNGETVGLTVEGCDFQVAQAKRQTENAKIFESTQAEIEIFVTGVTMASSVSFAAPASAPQGKLATGAEPDRPEIEKPEIADAAQTAVTATMPDRLGLQTIGGTLQNMVNFGNTTPIALAARGGTVVPATLDLAVITGNTFAHLTCAALLLGETTGLDASDNQLNCIAGFWVLVPSQTQLLLTDPQSLALLGATVALAMPLPPGSLSNTVNVAAAANSVYLYTSGNRYIDSNGNTWLPDTSVPSVQITPKPGPTTDWTWSPSPAPTISATSDPTLYQSERAGPSFSYTFTGLKPGFYSVTLDFAEIFYTKYPDSGIRIFDVAINSEPVLTNFDIGATVGPLAACSQTFTNIPSSGGQIVVQFTGTGNGSDHNAKISALSLSSVSSGAPFLGPGDETDSPLFFDQLAQVAWQGYTFTGSQARWRFDNNEMQGLTATAVLLLDDDNLYNENSGSLMLTGNRIDGQIPLPYTTVRDAGEAETQVTIKSRAETVASAFISTPQADMLYFLPLVAVNAVSRAVITSNMLTNASYSPRTPAACLIVNSSVAEPLVTIMGNLLVGLISVPARSNISTANLEDWTYLNTLDG
jgi:hypothetical protein